MEPIDIILLTHDRLDYLVRTVEALEQRTPEPFQMTIVDNASGPETRSWLAENRARFERVIFRATNAYVPAFDDGIAATTSDPYIVTDPDLVVPVLEPSWLARMLGLMERHPDFGLIGMGLDPVNRPPTMPPEVIDPARVVDADLVEENAGLWFQLIRRGALPGGYRSDHQACVAVRAAGYRVGWCPTVRALHLGWDDYVAQPGYLARKDAAKLDCYPDYPEVDLIARPPTLAELAVAAPVLAETRAAGVGDASVLEIAWGEPALGAAVEGPLTVGAPPDGRLPFDDAAAGAVVLLDPPRGAAALLPDACRVATRLVVAVASLEAFDGRPADELAPAGWTGAERPAIGDAQLEVARAAAGAPGLSGANAYVTLDDRERWLRFFASGAFGPAEKRLFVFSREGGAAGPPAVRHDPARVAPLRPAHEFPHARRRLTLRERVRLRTRLRALAGRMRRSGG
jgi:hypothetical protein